ncbi:MAG: hypothetical protein ACR2J4_06685 [Deinococcus sp.]
MQPSARSFKALPVGGLFLFKLHHPWNMIVGGGFFARHLVLPVDLAWDTFGEANGAASLGEVKARIGKYTHTPAGQLGNPVIGCILLAGPFFLSEAEWIPAPSDFASNIVQGKRYTTASEIGLQLYQGCDESRNRNPPLDSNTQFYSHGRATGRTGQGETLGQVICDF